MATIAIRPMQQTGLTPPSSISDESPMALAFAASMPLPVPNKTSGSTDIHNNTNQTRCNSCYSASFSSSKKDHSLLFRFARFYILLPILQKLLRILQFIVSTHLQRLLLLTKQRASHCQIPIKFSHGYMDFIPITKYNSPSSMQEKRVPKELQIVFER